MDKTLTIQPIINEKSMRNVKENNSYTFATFTKLNKIQVRNMVSSEYKVEVLSVNKVVTRSKARRLGQTRKFKEVKKPIKFLVKLKKGDTIDAFNIEKNK